MTQARPTYVGITSRSVEERIAERIRAMGESPGDFEYRVEEAGLTKAYAQQRESAYLNAGYTGHAGGAPAEDSNALYSLYIFWRKH